MNQIIGNYFDAVFPVREESAGNGLAIRLDRAIYFFIFLLAIAAPVSIAATNAAWISGMILWLVRAFIKPRLLFWRAPVDLPLFAFFGWCLLSSAFSYAPDLSFDRLRVLTLFPIAYLVTQNVAHRKTIKFLTAALIFSCLASVGWTFAERGLGRGMQVFGVQPNSALAVAGIRDGDTLLKINGKKFAEAEDLINAVEQNESVKINFYRPDYYADVEIRRDKLLNGASAEQKLGFSNWKRSRVWRSTGFYSHYTTYAEVLQLIMSLALGIFIALLSHRSAARQSSTFPFFSARSFLLLFLLVALAGMSLALLLTATRASQAAFLLSALAIVALGASRKTLLAVIAIFLPIAIIGAIYLQQTRKVGFVDAADNSTTWRQTVYREGFELLIKSPRHLTVGVGIDSINRFRCEWGLFANCTLPPGHLHSTPLQIAVECGLPALFFWLFVVFRYGKTLFDSIKKDVNDWFERGILLGAFGGLIGFFVSGLVHYNLGDSEVAMVFYLIMGLSLVLTRKTKETLSAKTN